MSTDAWYTYPDPEIFPPTPTVPKTKTQKMLANQSLLHTSGAGVCTHHEDCVLECPDCHGDTANASQATRGANDVGKQSHQIVDGKPQHLATMAVLAGPQILQNQLNFPETSQIRAHLCRSAQMGAPHNLRTTFLPISSDESLDTEAMAFDNAGPPPDLTVHPPILGPVDRPSHSRSPRKKSRNLKRATLKRNAEAVAATGWVHYVPDLQRKDV